MKIKHGFRTIIASHYTKFKQSQDYERKTLFEINMKHKYGNNRWIDKKSFVEIINIFIIKNDYLNFQDNNIIISLLCQLTCSHS